MPETDFDMQLKLAECLVKVMNGQSIKDGAVAGMSSGADSPAESVRQI